VPSDLIAQHQAKFDRQFPHGAAAAWQGDSKTAYLVPRIMVTGQRGLDPEIWLPVFAGSNKTLGPFRVLSREDLPSAGPPIIRLTLDSVEAPLLLNAGVPAVVAEAMAADRQQFMDLAPHGGARVFDGDAPE
jgi:hypothetical protein